MIIDENNEKVVHKGHNYNFTSNDYRDILNNNSFLAHPFRNIFCKNHQIYTGELLKMSLSASDDKNCFKDNRIDITHIGYKKFGKNTK